MKNEMIHVGVIGLGNRGTDMIKNVVLPMPGIQVVAVCDEYEDRVKKGMEIVLESGASQPAGMKDYCELLDTPDLDAVFIFSAWESHIPAAIKAMEKGIAVVMEVGGAYSVQQCWDLVHASENNATPCMLLENCCFGRREMMVMHMVRNNILGDIVHASGGYHHDLRDEISFGRENRHYRLRNYLARNCENYPTHELGPIAKILDINRGNRMVSLTSTASSAKGLKEFIRKSPGADQSLLNREIAQGDIVTTVIKCARGETITITLDTTLPRFYSRGFSIRGTKGMYEEATDSVFLDGVHDSMHFKWKEQWGNAEAFSKDYEHPTWKEYLSKGVQGGHDGMDWLAVSAFVRSLEKGIPMPVDVYDTAAWMCITALSEMSIQLGSTPVSIPDFTNGLWIGRTSEFS